MNIDNMRDLCHKGQWSLDDIDWDGPGRLSKKKAEYYREFMTDLFWIEYIAFPIFTAVAPKLKGEAEQDIYSTFYADEKRHADAELMLMRRWGIAPRQGWPTPRKEIRVLQESLSKHGERMHPAVLTALIPLLELMLDGALVKHLSTVIDDPVFLEAFDGINRDEARHLAVGFHMMEVYGTRGSAEKIQDLWNMKLEFSHFYALFFGLLPYFARAQTNLVAMGLDWQLIENMLDRYIHLGERNEAIANNISYKLIRAYATKLRAGDFVLENIMLRLSDSFG